MSAWDAEVWPSRLPSDALTPRELEELRLRALEQRLADVRRLLAHAALIRCQVRGEVRALAELVAGVHHQVLEELERR